MCECVSYLFVLLWHQIEEFNLLIFHVVECLIWSPSLLPFDFRLCQIFIDT